MSTKDLEYFRELLEDAESLDTPDGIFDEGFDEAVSNAVKDKDTDRDAGSDDGIEASLEAEIENGPNSVEEVNPSELMSVSSAELLEKDLVGTGVDKFDVEPVKISNDDIEIRNTLGDIPFSTGGSSSNDSTEEEIDEIEAVVPEAEPFVYDDDEDEIDISDDIYVDENGNVYYKSHDIGSMNVESDDDGYFDYIIDNTPAVDEEFARTVSTQDAATDNFSVRDEVRPRDSVNTAFSRYNVLFYLTQIIREFNPSLGSVMNDRLLTSHEYNANEDFYNRDFGMLMSVIKNISGTV